MNLRFIAAATTALAFTAPPASAWQADVHYGLTLWLAKNVGFSEQAAANIAAADVGQDQGVPDAIEDVIRSACFGNKHIYTANLVRANHFPSAVKVPTKSQLRVVQPNAAPAWDEVKRVLESKQTGIYLLNDFGPVLHALQDSWSHQGMPGIPDVCDDEYAWGHPVARGGPYCTRADVTMYWADKDVPATAKATYDALLMLRSQIEKNGGSQTLLAGKAKEWKDLQSHVDVFAKAATKSQKAVWFERHEINDTTFLAGISLPDGALTFPMPRAATRAYESKIPAEKEAPPAEVLSLFQRFFEFVVFGKDLSDLVDWESVVGRFSLAPKCRGSLAPAEIQKTLNALLRLVDSGSVFTALDELACTIPQPDCSQGKARLMALAARAEKEDKGPQKLDALLVPYRHGELFAVRRSKEGYIAIASLRQAPYHALVVEARRSGSAWRVTAIKLLMGAN